jgi:2-polyprenyl-3-methyl-5-hydroxy-6-metoxy-1,4-benzoquinol methylase
LARSVPPIDETQIEELYREVEDPDYLVSEEERRASFKKTLEDIGRYYQPRPPGRLLEVGSSVGLFLEEAEKLGWSATGIEPSVWAAKEAERRGLNVHTGTLESFNGRCDPFDVVAMWDVLEHLIDPLDCMKRLQALLKPDGLLALSTVNIGGLGARILRGRWPWLMRMHLHYFTRRSLGEMARQSGLELLHLKTYPKVLKLGYLLDRARGMIGPLADGGLWAAERLRLSDRSVRIDWGDILLLVAKKPS